MSSDRLTELRRQRALLQEHGAWLEREIATEEARSAKTEGGGASASTGLNQLARTPDTAAPPVSGPLPVAAPMAANASGLGPPAEDVESAAEAVLAEYRVAPGEVQSDVRKGCLLYFVLGFLLFAAAVAGLYFVLRH
jgi:hypothetical protein